MDADDGCGVHRRHVALEGDFHRVGLARVGNGVDDAAALHDHAGAHGDGLLGDVVEGREPAFAELLFAADFVEVDDEVRLFCVEVARRVVEGDMAVFTDADEADVDDFVEQVFAELVDGGLEVSGVSWDEVGFLERAGELCDEAFLDVFAEAGRVRFGQADVFVEVEHRDFRPVDAWLLDELRQHVELAGARGDDDAALALFSEGLADFLCTEFGGGDAAFQLGLVDGQTHDAFPWVDVNVSPARPRGWCLDFKKSM